MKFLRLYIVAIFLGLLGAVTPVGFDSALAGDAPAAAKKTKGAKSSKATKKTKAKKAANGKSATTKGKSAAKKTVKAKPGAKAKATTNTTSTADGKATEAKSEKTPAKGKKVAKVPATGESAQPATKAATTTPPTDDQHLNDELQAYEDPESGPWLYFFVAFLVASVGLLVYLRKKRLAGAAGQGGDELQHSKPDTAFGSSLSSLDLDKSKTSQPLSTQPPKSRVG